MMKKPNFLRNKKFKYGSVATAITAGFVVIVVVVNIVATLLLDQYPLTIDMTSSGKYEISEETLDYAKNLSMNVDIYFIGDEAQFNDPVNTYVYQVNELLRKFDQYSDKVTLNYVDLETNPGFAAQYPDENFTTGDILFVSDLRTQKKNWQDMYDITADSSGYYIQSAKSHAESDITSSLLYVTDSEPTKVVIETGHDEAEANGLQSLLQDNGYEVSTITNISGELDDSAQMIVINAPTKDFTELEIQKLDEFLTNGGKYGKQLIYAGSPRQGSLPNLEGFLAEWGISFEAGTALETDSSNTYGSAYYSVQSLSDVDLTTVGRTEAYTLPFIMLNVRPVNILFDAQYNITVTSLLTTSSTTVLRPLDASDGWTMDNADPAQAYNSIVMSQKSTDNPDPEQVEKSTVVAFSSSDIFSSYYMQIVSSYGNAQYTIDLINTLANKEAEITVVAKEMMASTFEISASQALILGIVFVAVIPLAIIIVGVVVFLRRRNL